MGKQEIGTQKIEVEKKMQKMYKKQQDHNQKIDEQKL